MMEIKIKEFKPRAYSLCSSVCIISVNGEDFPVKLISGGSVSWYPNDEIIDGPWTVSRIPSKFKHLEKEITKVVNDTLPWGCCGGCI